VAITSSTGPRLMISLYLQQPPCISLTKSHNEDDFESVEC
jgi:hypothetical protein